MATMTVEQGKCAIYPSAQMQLCMRVRVLVVPLKPGDDPKAAWIGDDGADRLRFVDLSCSQRGLERLLQKIDDGTKPPTPRPRREEQSGA